MPTDAGLVTQLCERWEEARARGQNLAVEELCRDHPELSDEVRRAIHHLGAVDRAVAGEAGSTDPDLPRLPSGCRYRLVKFLTQGGLGRVYAGDDLELGREVAVKFVRPDRAGPAALARFRREAEITGRLEHPAVVPVYGLVELPDGGFCYAMRLLRGDTLSAAIDHLCTLANQDRPAALRKLLRHFINVCDAVAFAHSHGIIHRDLKPTNVMLGEFGETWVLDWGLAKTAGRGDTDDRTAPPEVSVESSNTPQVYQTLPGSAIGTPGFMSPEQSRGETNMIGPAADVFSLGATLGSILVGRGRHTDERMEAWLAETPRSVPRALLAVCKKAMADDVSERYAGARELAADVERWLADEPVSAYRDPFPERARRWAKRNRVTVIGLTALLFAAAPLSAALALVSDRARQQAVEDQRRVEREKEEADRQRDRAEQNLDMADRLAADVVERVVEHPRLKQADLNETRLDILRQVGGLYEQVASQRSGDPKAAAAIARSDRLIGVVRRDTGHHADSLASLQKAESELARLAAANPDDTAAAEELGRTRIVLGRLLYELGRPTEAAAVLANARRGLEDTVSHTAAPPNAPRHLGLALNNLGLVLHGLGRHEAADEAYRAGLAVLEPRIGHAHDPDSDARIDAAMVLSNHGLLLWEMRRMAPARQAFERAVALQDAAAVARPELRSLKREEAHFRANLGGLLQEVGETAEATRQTREAVKAMETLVGEFPSVPEYQLTLARLVLRLNFLLGQSDDERTLKASGEAVNLLRKLVARHPGVADYTRQLSNGLLVRGQILSAAGRGDGALPVFEEAAALVEELARRHPAEATYRLDYAIACGELGNLYYGRGKYAEAEQSYRWQLEVYELLSRDFPSVPEYRERVGRAAYNVGMAVGDGGKREDAVGLYTRAITILAGPVAANPDLSTNRDVLRNAYWGRADCRAKLGRYAEAVPDWRAMLALIADNDRDKRTFRLELARALLASGDSLGARVEAEAVATHPNATVDQLTGAAGIEVGAADPANAEPAYTTAVVWLEQARAGGRLAGPKAATALRADAQLAPLRGRPDFEKLLKAVEGAPEM